LRIPVHIGRLLVLKTSAALAMFNPFKRHSKRNAELGEGVLPF
jgi:hypothetical protein